MAIEIFPPRFPDALRNKNFTLTVTAKGVQSGVIGSGGGGIGGGGSGTYIIEKVTGISATLLGDTEPDLKITPGATADSFIISGFYQKGFSDLAKFITKEGSTKTETETTVTSLSNILPNKNIILYQPSDITSVTRTFTIVVTYTGITPGLTETFTINQIVLNDIRNHTSYLQSYYGNTNPFVFSPVFSGGADGKPVIWTNALGKEVKWTAE